MVSKSLATKLTWGIISCFLLCSQFSCNQFDGVGVLDSSVTGVWAACQHGEFQAQTEATTLDWGAPSGFRFLVILKSHRIFWRQSSVMFWWMDWIFRLTFHQCHNLMLVTEMADQLAQVCLGGGWTQERSPFFPRSTRKCVLAKFKHFQRTLATPLLVPGEGIYGNFV